MTIDLESETKKQSVDDFRIETEEKIKPPVELAGCLKSYANGYIPTEQAIEQAWLNQQANRLTTRSIDNNERYQAITQIAEQCANLPELDSRRADEILGYDQSPIGLWGDDFSKTDLPLA